MASRDEKESQDCCRFLTRAEKILLILLILTSAVLLALFLFIAVVNLRSRYLKNCETSDCVKTAALLLESTDFDRNPCENFLEYVCGKYDHVEDFQTRRDDKSANIRRLLRDSELLTLPKRFYEACTNTTAIESDSGAVLLGIINELGGWPILLGQEWPENFDWLKFTSRARSLGVKSDWFITFHSHLLVEDDENSTSTTKLLKIGVPSWSSPIPSTLKQSYYEAMVKVAIALESSHAVAWRELKKVANFDNNLRIIGQRARNKSLYNFDDLNVERTVGDLNSMWPENDLSEILNDIYQGSGDFDANSTIIIESESYLFELNTLLARTPRRTQANFAIWKVIEWYLPYLTDEIRKAYENYSPIESREDFCLSETLKRYSQGIETVSNSEILQNHHSQDQIQEMVDLISKELNLEQIQVIVGRPIDDSNPTRDDDVNFVSDNILKIINEDRYERENYFFECLTDEISLNCTNNLDDSEITDKEEIVYNPESKTIYISNDILRSSRYSGSLPNYLNYASLGTVISAKILDISTTETLPIVDLVYLGYLRKRQLSGTEKRLPGLDSTPLQIFWIYSAYINCPQENNSSLIEDILNSDYFKRDFEC